MFQIPDTPSERYAGLMSWIKGEIMYLIAGLGNPEKKYNGTRHNTGFAAVDALLQKLGDLKLNDTKFNGVFTKTRIGTEAVIIVKPLTYMNLSGNCIAPLANFFKIPAEHVIVLCDDINLDVGRMRIRPSGSAGGHNGLKSIIASLGSEQFVRVRIGVGMKPEKMDLADHVLSRFSAQDETTMQEMYQKGAEACIDIIEKGVEKSMSLYNTKKG